MFFVLQFCHHAQLPSLHQQQHLHKLHDKLRFWLFRSVRFVFKFYGAGKLPDMHRQYHMYQLHDKLRFWLCWPVFVVFKFHRSVKLPDLFKQHHLHHLRNKLCFQRCNAVRTLLNFYSNIKLSYLHLQHDLHGLFQYWLRNYSWRNMRIVSEFHWNVVLQNMFGQQHLHYVRVNELRVEFTFEMFSVFFLHRHVKLPHLLQQQHMHILFNKLLSERTEQMLTLFRSTVELPDVYESDSMHIMHQQRIRNWFNEQMSNMCQFHHELLHLQQQLDLSGLSGIKSSQRQPVSSLFSNRNQLQHLLICWNLSHMRDRVRTGNIIVSWDLSFVFSWSHKLCPMHNSRSVLQVCRYTLRCTDHWHSHINDDLLLLTLYINDRLPQMHSSHSLSWMCFRICSQHNILMSTMLSFHEQLLNLYWSLHMYWMLNRFRRKFNFSMQNLWSLHASMC